MKIIRLLHDKFFVQPRLNLFSTIYFNFSVLPFSQAVKIPIYLHGEWNLRSLNGKVFIKSDKIQRGMYHFGADTSGYFTASVSTLSLGVGSLLILEKNVRIGQGVQICMYPQSTVVLHEGCGLTDSVKLICKNKIEVGRYSDLTWECQIMDYNSHFVVTDNNCIKSICHPVQIGDYCWICNRTTIMPGTRLPDRVIVAQGSLLNKDYVANGLESNSMIGGSPAKVLKKGIKRIYTAELYRKLYKRFDSGDVESLYCEEVGFPIFNKIN